MPSKLTIFDEINTITNPYKEIGIPTDSSDETIKEAYKLVRNSIPPHKRDMIDLAYSMIKTPLLRQRYNLLRNRPLDTMDEIKKHGIRPTFLNTAQWIEQLK
jgi:hypothetical protein